MLRYPCALEDLFDEAYYLQQVQKAYKSELGTQKITLSTKPWTIVDRVEDALRELGVEKFNKVRVAKRIMTDLAGKKLASLGEKTVDRFQTSFRCDQRSRGKMEVG